MVKIYFHSKFRPSSSKIEQFGGHFVLFLAAILFFTFWLRVVKIYFDTKFRPSSSKIEQFGGHFVFWRSFCFLVAILFLAAIFFTFGCGRSRYTCMQNFGLLARKLSELCSISFYGGHFVFWWPFCFLAVILFFTP